MHERVRITKRYTFEAAHSLPNYEGKCSRLHGHSYKLEVTVSGCIDTESITRAFQNDEPVLAEEGMVIDFSALKRCIKSVVEVYDHSNLNDHFVLPTAEVMSVQIFNDIQYKLGNHSVRVESVKLWETEDSYAEYRGEKV